MPLQTASNRGDRALAALPWPVAKGERWGIMTARETKITLPSASA